MGARRTKLRRLSTYAEYPTVTHILQALPIGTDCWLIESIATESPPTRDRDA